MRGMLPARLLRPSARPSLWRSRGAAARRAGGVGARGCRRCRGRHQSSSSDRGNRLHVDPDPIDGGNQDANARPESPAAAASALPLARRRASAPSSARRRPCSSCRSSGPRATPRQRQRRAGLACRPELAGRRAPGQRGPDKAVIEIDGPGASLGLGGRRRERRAEGRPGRALHHHRLRERRRDARR